MVEINEIGATAFVISCIRAMEREQEQKLFDDPYAEWFVNDEIREKVRQLIEAHPLAQEVVRYRVCIMNEILQRGIEAGVRQVVSLGAGFDMRSEIFRTEGVAFCDVDQPAVLQFKRRVLEERGVAPCPGVPCNYLEVDLPQRLAETGMDIGSPTLFVWEGNTMYLPVERIHDFLDRLRRRVPSMRIALDYFSDKVIRRTTGDAKITEATDLFERSFGVKWLTGFDDLSVFEEKNNLQVAESGGMLEVGERYAPEAAADLSNIMGLYSYCVLSSGETGGA